MKLRHTIFTTVSGICLLFLLLSFLEMDFIINRFTYHYPQVIDYYLIIYAIIGCSLFLLTLVILRLLVINKIEHVDREIDQQVQNRTKLLEDENNLLQQEIVTHKTIEHELILHEERLIRLAHYDELTSLPNRVFFNEILNKAINHAKRQKSIFAVLIIDIDNFKTVNDAFGHATGDSALKEFSHRFSKVLRAGDIVARLSGDEFIVMLNDIGNTKFAGAVADKIQQSCLKAIQVDSHELYLSASIGISVFPGDGESLEDLQKNADMAMYKAKRSGGASYFYHTQEMNVAAHEYVILEAALRKAINNDEFILYFQPQFNLHNGTIKTVEALIRWVNPKLGIVNPDKFIPLAEETGLIMPIGEWALQEACRINKAWQDAGYDPVIIAVNISPKQFRYQDVAKLVSNSLKKSGLAAKYLELEITETAVMENVESAIKKLNAVCEMGVRISIDDFGTGYTSISYLRQFPVSVLKIDQTFIKGIPENPNDLAITSAVIGLGHNLGLQVVAEGVETREQMEYLVTNKCDLAQGYFLSRPVPAKKVELQFTRYGKAQDSIVKV